jgi:hypothetical protein
VIDEDDEADCPAIVVLFDDYYDAIVEIFFSV